MGVGQARHTIGATPLTTAVPGPFANPACSTACSSGISSHTFVRLTGPASQQAAWSFFLTHPIRQNTSFSPRSITSPAGTIPASTKPPAVTRPPPLLPQLQEQPMGTRRPGAPRGLQPRRALVPLVQAGRPQGGKGRGRQGPPRGEAAAPRGPAPPLAVPPQPQEPSPGLQTMGPAPAGALGTCSAHPDAPGAPAAEAGSRPRGCFPRPRTPAAPPEGDAAARPSLACFSGGGGGCGGFPAGR